MCHSRSQSLVPQAPIRPDRSLHNARHSRSRLGERRPRSPWGRGTTPPCRARTVTPEWARNSAPSLRPRAPLGTTGRGAVVVTAEGGPAPPACGWSGCERWGGDMAASLGRAAAGNGGPNAAGLLRAGAEPGVGAWREPGWERERGCAGTATCACPGRRAARGLFWYLCGPAAC